MLFRDISEEMRAETALRQSEAQFAFLDRPGAETGRSPSNAVLAITTRSFGEHLNLSICAYADMD